MEVGGKVCREWWLTNNNNAGGADTGAVCVRSQSCIWLLRDRKGFDTAVGSNGVPDDLFSVRDGDNVVVGLTCAGPLVGRGECSTCFGIQEYRIYCVSPIDREDEWSDRV